MVCNVLRVAHSLLRVVKVLIALKVSANPVLKVTTVSQDIRLCALLVITAMKLASRVAAHVLLAVTALQVQ